MSTNKFMMMMRKIVIEWNQKNFIENHKEDQKIDNLR